MLSWPLMVWVTLSLVGTILPQSNKFVAVVKIKDTDESKLNDSAALYCYYCERGMFYEQVYLQLWSLVENRSHTLALWIRQALRHSLQALPHHC